MTLTVNSIEVPQDHSISHESSMKGLSCDHTMVLWNLNTVDCSSHPSINPLSFSPFFGDEGERETRKRKRGSRARERETHEQERVTRERKRERRASERGTCVRERERDSDSRNRNMELHKFYKRLRKRERGGAAEGEIEASER